jgi:hypothetical protein
MNLSKPLTSVIPSVEGDVLTVLASAERAFTGLQVQKIIDTRGRNALQYSARLQETTWIGK